MKYEEKSVKELIELATDFKQLMYEISLKDPGQMKENFKNAALKIADDFASIFISEFVCKPSWKK